MQHYEARCAGEGVAVTRLRLEAIAEAEGATALLAQLGHAPAALQLPGRANEGRPLASVPADLRAEIAARLAGLEAEARAYA